MVFCVIYVRVQSECFSCMSEIDGWEKSSTDDNSNSSVRNNSNDSTKKESTKTLEAHGSSLVCAVVLMCKMYYRRIAFWNYGRRKMRWESKWLFFKICARSKNSTVWSISLELIKKVAMKGRGKDRERKKSTSYHLRWIERNEQHPFIHKRQTLRHDRCGKGSWKATGTT